MVARVGRRPEGQGQGRSSCDVYPGGRHTLTSPQWDTSIRRTEAFLRQTPDLTRVGWAPRHVDYSAGVIVAQGTGSSATVIACGPGGSGWAASAGETYTILAFDDQEDGVGNGGLLDITVETAPDVPSIEATINPIAQFDKATGGAYVSGTATCSGEADFAFVDVQLRQRVGRILIQGFGETEIACTGSVEPWTVFVLGDNGLFKGGKGATATAAVACNISGCGEYFADQTVQLKGRTH